MKKVVVVGAGLGGLSAAIRLARAGFTVTILEKNERVGGKMNVWKDAGYTFDTGPTLLTMPFVVRDLFASAGERMEDHLELVPLDPICRYVFSDGSLLNASSDIAAMERELDRMSPGEGRAFRSFLNHGKQVYDAAAGPFLFTGFGSMGLRRTAGYLRFLPSVFKIDAFRTLDRGVRAAFRDERVRQMMNRFATYNGSSPYRVPATLAIIPYVEFSMGGWYVRGGMYGLARALEKLAAGLGVLIRTSSAVAAINVRDGVARGVRLASGEELRADAVISNVDAFLTGRDLLGEPEGAGLRREREPSLSGFVMLLGVRREFPQLAHHNVFFSSDYRKEFSALFGAQTPAEDPTIYVSLSARTDPSHAPAKGSNLFVLVNAPALSEHYDWPKRTGEYRNQVLARLEARGLPDIDRFIETERVITPVDFEAQYGAHRGGIYGTSSNGMFSAFLRPPNRLRRPKRLYLAGGSSHPGGGIPLVLLSGSIAASMVREDIAP